MPDRFAEICQRPQADPGMAAGWCGPHARAASRMGFAAATVFLSGILAACSTGGDTGFSLFVDPGKYQYHTCPQIAAEVRNWSQRRKDLKSLMERAEQSVGGSAVGFIAYRGDYVAAGEELEQLQVSAHSKNCDQDQAWRSSTAIQ